MTSLLPGHVTERPLYYPIDMDDIMNFSNNSAAQPEVTSAVTTVADGGNSSSPAYVDASKNFIFYSLSFIIPFGLICNTLSIFVFMSPPLRPRAASWYLAALALSDDMALLTAMVEYWFKDPHIGLPIIKNSYAVCIINTHISYTSRVLSAWLVTSFTVERFIGVVFPLKRAALSTTTHARRLVVGEFIICFVITSFTLFTIDVVDHKSYGKECDVLPERAHIYSVFNTVFLIFGSIIIPILIIFTLNMFILYKVYQRKVLFTPKNMRFSGMQPVVHNKASRDFNIATLLLVVSTTFVILNAPYCVCWVVLYFQHFKEGWDGNNTEVHWHLFAAKYVTTVPYYLNYSINFALYSLCARAFRVAVGRVFSFRANCCRFLRKDDHSDTKNTVMEHLCMEQRCIRGAGRTPVEEVPHTSTGRPTKTKLKVSDKRRSSRSRSSESKSRSASGEKHADDNKRDTGSDGK